MSRHLLGRGGAHRIKGTPGIALLSSPHREIGQCTRVILRLRRSEYWCLHTREPSPCEVQAPYNWVNCKKAKHSKRVPLRRLRRLDVVHVNLQRSSLKGRRRISKVGENVQRLEREDVPPINAPRAPSNCITILRIAGHHKITVDNIV